MKRIVHRILGILVAILLGLVWYLTVAGFPSWAVERLLSRTEGRFVIQADGIRLDITEGLHIRNLRYFRKGMVGPPGIHVKEAILDIRVLAGFIGQPWIRGVRLIDGYIRPEFLAGPLEVSSADTAAPTMLVRVELDHCILYDLYLDRLSALVRVQESGVQVEDLVVQIKQAETMGRINGGFAYLFQGRLTTGALDMDLDPHLLLPLMQVFELRGAMQATRRFDFPGAIPRWRIHFRHEGIPEGALTVDGTYWMEDFRYRDVPCRRADGRFRLRRTESSSTLDISPLMIIRPEGMAEGGLSIDLRRHQLAFNFDSTLHPDAVTHLAGVLDDGQLHRWSFKGPVRLTIQGTNDWREEHLSYRASIEGRRVGFGLLLADELSFTVSGSNRVHRADDLQASLYGGRMSGSVRVDLSEHPQSTVAYAVDIQLHEANFGRVVAAFSDTTERHAGTVMLDLHLNGEVGDQVAHLVRGGGHLRIYDGRVFLLPVFGGFSRVMTKLIPGMDFVLRQTDATMDLKIRDGKVYSDKIAVLGDVLGIEAKGACDFDGRLDYAVRVQLMRSPSLFARLLRSITYPLRRLMEFRLRGTAKNPEWYPINFSRELLEKVGLRDRPPSDP